MTSIEWTRGDDGKPGKTWNPVTGCDKVSPGCGMPRFEGDAPGGCYALAMATRLKGMGQEKYQTDGDPRTSGPGFGVAIHPDALDIPFKWRKPQRVFVNSMSDLFHPRIPDGFIGSVFDVMGQTPQHTYQILTKRPKRMRSLLNRWADAGWMWRRDDMLWCGPTGGPLPNVWLGTSVESQRYADERIPELLATPAAVRFLSCEPLLGPLNLIGQGGDLVGAGIHALPDPPEYDGGEPVCQDHGAENCQRSQPHAGCTFVDWVIVGGESGPDARPMHPAWVRSLRDQCEAAHVPFFFKQWGGRTPKAGGRSLDGREWSEFPASPQLAAS